MKNIEEQKFAVGDIVKSTVPIGYNSIENAIGKVVGFTKPDLFNQTVGVQFEADVNGHNADGAGKSYNCWWCVPNDLVLIKKHRGRPFGSKNKKKVQDNSLDWAKCPDCEDFKKQIKEKDKEIEICKERIEELAQQRENLQQKTDMLNSWKETYYNGWQETKENIKQKDHRIAVLERTLEIIINLGIMPFVMPKNVKEYFIKQAEKELEEESKC